MNISNEQYNSIMQGYRDRRRERDYLIQDRRRMLYTRIPELSEIDEEIRQAGHDSLANPDIDVEKVISDLHEKKMQLIRKSGYPDDFLDPPYTCNDCRDTGFIDGEPCHCLNQQINNVLFEQEPLLKTFQQKNFDTFDFRYYSTDYFDNKSGMSSYDAAKKAYDTAKLFVKNFDEKGGSLVFYGTTGTGKTFLSDCIAGALIESGHTVVYLSAIRLFDVISGHNYGYGKNDDTDYNNLYNSELLVIDDLGTETANKFTESALFDVINTRIISRRSTIISTNMNMGQLKDMYNDRIFSRLTENYHWLHMFGNDIRLEKSLEDYPHENS